MNRERHPASGGAAAAGDLSPARPPADARTMAYREDLAAVRQFTQEQARQADLPPALAADLVIAVNELAANTLAHTAGAGTVTIWSTPRQIICQVSDSGHITDPLAGTRPEDPAAPGGHLGLWVVQQICDLVHVQTSAQGTTIHLHMLLD